MRKAGEHELDYILYKNPLPKQKVTQAIVRWDHAILKRDIRPNTIYERGRAPEIGNNLPSIYDFSEDRFYFWLRKCN